MIFDTDGQCYVATKADDFKGWEILGVMQFKPAVKVVHCRRSRPGLRIEEFRTVYCADEVAPPCHSA